MWNLKLLYKSVKDPQIELDIQELEKLCDDFSKNYSKGFTDDEKKLQESLKDYFYIESKVHPKPIMYLTLSIHSDSKNDAARSLLNLITARVAKSLNKIAFFSIELGKIAPNRQKEILKNPNFTTYRFFLECAFDDAKYNLSEAEEKILNLKKQPAYDMWVDSHEKVTSGIMVTWKGKNIPISYALNIVKEQKKSDRVKLSGLINTELKKISFFSEAEINAIVTDKKINDELKGFKTPYEDTVRGYRNDPKTVENLVTTVSKNFKVSHKFFKLKAKLFKLKTLNYSDRQAEYKKIKGNFSYAKSQETLLKIFNDFDPKYKKILEEYIKNGQIDSHPREGKHGGAYCWGNFQNPTFVLLNHSDNFYALETFAHEMGHAFHTEMARSQGPVYMNYSTSTAETASTFFEGLAFDTIFETLSEKEKVSALHDKLNSEMNTIFRQIAGFNYELDIHNTVRKNGFISAPELATLHDKNMLAYLGPVFKFLPDEGYFFVQWSHIRNFFYVYTYAYGLLVSKVLLKRYKENTNFKDSIEKFLRAGGKDTPENIFKEIGIDVSSPSFFQEGIEEIEKDIEKLRKML